MSGAGVSTGALAGVRVLVVGGSSGIGRGSALRMIRQGADVVVAARRVERLRQLVAEADGGRTLQLDLTSSESCRALVEGVRVALRAVDVVLFTAGAAPLRRFRHTSEEEWEQTFATNVFGIHRVLAGLLDDLAPRAVVAVVSSETVAAPRSHLGAYGASKAALEHSIHQWREEHPWIRFVIVSLGATVPTEFGDAFESSELGDALDQWAKAGLNQMEFMDTEEVCDVIVAMLGSLVSAPTVGLPTLVLRSPAPADPGP